MASQKTKPTTKKATASTKKPSSSKTTSQKPKADVSQKETTPTAKKASTDNFNWNDALPLLQKFVLPVVLILAIVWYAFTIRAGTATMDGLDRQVESQVMQNIQNVIAQQVQQQYPNLNEQNRQELIYKEYQKVLDTGTLTLQGQQINIEEVITQQAQMLREEFQAENGQTYLSAIDPYLFYNYADDILENGHQGDEIRNGTPFATYRLAPNGRSVGEMSFHTWLLSSLQEMQGVTENSDVGEKTAAIFFVSAIIAALSAIPCYLILRNFTSDLYALAGSLLMVSIGTFVSRTVAGFVDTDAYVVFFSLCVVAALVYAFMFANRTYTVVLASLAGLFQGLFMWAWSNGWFIFLFSLVAFVGYITYLVLINLTSKLDKKELSQKQENALITVGFYTGVSVLATYFITGTNLFVRTYEAIFRSFDKIASVSTTYIWPNVYSTVAELNPASFGQILQAVGGKSVLFLALLGLVFLALDYRAKDKQHKTIKTILLSFSVIWFLAIVVGEVFVSLTNNAPFVFLILLFIPVALSLITSMLNANSSPKIFITILLSVWMAGTIYMSFNGTRFILLLTPAFAIAFGTALFYIAKALNKFFTEEFNIEKPQFKQLWGAVTAAVIFVILFAPVGSQAMQMSQGAAPNFDDSWYDAMYNIRDNSSEDAIITSWWDFGHFFAAISQRGVTFDGGSQTTPQSHWVGKLLVESDEDVSVDILQMLVCGGNNAFDTIEEITQDPTNGVWTNQLIYQTLGKQNKEEILQNYSGYDFTQEEIDQIMAELACENPRENFLITSGDMVGKGAVWAHWGLWDFTKKYVHDNYRQNTAQEIATTLDANLSLIEQYVDELETIDVQAQTQDVNRENLINQWLAPYPSYAGGLSCGLTNTTVTCQNGLEIDFMTGDINQESLQGNSIARVIFPGESMRIVEHDEDGQFDLVVIPSQNGIQVQAMQAPLGTSLFTKLFYLNGANTTHFENFYQTQTQTAGNVIVWKTNFSSN